MVKPDIKHNYYADLELPASASLDDIRKAYRKLALQYHPDRNSGHECEVVPKFQAIQAASEVLCDPAVKEKYDVDRRKAALNSSFAPRVPTPNSPYAANSAYPPPPRRTQPGTWQRPGQPPGAPPNPAANGADRFSNFPRPAPTARKDPAQDRTNVFRAWQNMNNADQRPRSGQYNAPPPSQAPPQPSVPPANKARPPQPPPMQPQPPPRFDAKPRYQPPPDPEGIDKRQSAWAAFQQASSGNPGVQRNASFRTPNKPGFNPNAPGSDEKAAPPGDRNYMHSHSAEDFSRGRVNPNGPPPRSQPPFGVTNTPPTSPQNQRPRPGPQQPSSNRAPSDQVPFAEGTRERTPYTHSWDGDKPEFLREGLRRSYSWRDASKLSPNDGADRARARSSSPNRAGQEQQHRETTFDVGDSSEASDAEITNDSTSGGRQGQTKTTNGLGSRFANGANNEAQSDTEQRRKPSMYADPSPSSTPSPLPFNSKAWTARMFGSYSTSRAQQRAPSSSRIPSWAVPASVDPTLKCAKQDQVNEWTPDKDAFVTAADEVYINASKDEQQAYLRFQEELRKEFDCIPQNLDMLIFSLLIAKAYRGESSGDTALDRILRDISLNFDTVGYAQKNKADEQFRDARFNYTHEPEQETSNGVKSRSEENINTAFSPEGWHGKFTGEPDYFAPPNTNGRKQSSPARRSTPLKKASSQHRSATFDLPTPSGGDTPYEEVKRAWGSDGTPLDIPRMASVDKGFNQEEWQEQFKDPNWGLPTQPPSPGKGGAGARKRSQSRKVNKAQTWRGVGTQAEPHVSDDDDTGEVQGTDGQPEHGAPIDEGDAMEIDDGPPAQQNEAQPIDGATQADGTTGSGAQYSRWREPQSQERGNNRKSSSASRRRQSASSNKAAGKFNTNLDDLRNVEPLAPKDRTGDTINVADLGSSLPFQSQPSANVHDEALTPRELNLPPLPKAPPEPQRISKTTWRNYTAVFGQYVKEFHAYNGKMLQHFQGREQQAQAQLANGTGWLEATGDAVGILTAPTGFGPYMRGVREDKVVRETWMLAWEKHTDAVLSFEKLRERVKKLVTGGMLVDH